MKKKILFGIGAILIIGCMLFVLTGCDNKENNTNNSTSNNASNQQNSTKTADHKIYKYVKMSSDVASNLLYSATSLFGDTFYVHEGEKYYKPCIIAEFDTETGKATKATLYVFFRDYEDNENVNNAIENYNSSSSESKKYYTNIQKGRIPNENEVSYLSVDLTIDSYIYTQFIDTYIIKSQDIENYKDRIYYSRLYNYSSNPPHEEGANCFEETLEGIRIEWSDDAINPLSDTKEMTETNTVLQDNNNNEQSNNEVIDNTINDELNDNTEDMKEKLVGTWEYTVPDDIEDTYENPGDIYTYTFRSNGTAKFSHFKKWSQLTDEWEFSKYEYDGNKFRMVEKLDDGDYNIIEHEITLNDGSFKEKDTGRTYNK